MTDPGLYGGLFADAQMQALFSDRATLQGMLDFEAALARDEAAEGVIPADAAAAIAAACKAGLYDIAAIGRETTHAGNPAIPLVRMLTEKVAETDPEAARWVHWGATSQDAIDTGRLVQIAAGLRLIETRIARLAALQVRLADRHRATVMPGRTLLQHALPTTFGLKVAYWLDAIIGHASALMRLTPNAPLQIGGAAGTLASLGAKGADLQERMTGSSMAVPWHATRQALVRLGAELGLLAGTLGKIGHDVSLLMQTEVAEAFEPSAPGKGGSSALPHKRNPVQSLMLCAIAQRTPGLVATLLAALPQEHERGVGGWHAEWEVVPQLFTLTGAALNHAIAMTEGLEIDEARMRANLDLTHGLIMSERIALALGPFMPRLDAKRLVETACRKALAEGCHLRAALLAEPRIAASLAAGELDRLFDPASYLGAADAVIERVLALYSLNFSR